MRYISLERTYDQSELDAEARRIASGLYRLGVGSGDAVGLLLLNEIEFLTCTRALSMLDAYPVAISWHSSASEVAYIAADADLKAIFAHDVIADIAAAGIPAELPLVVLDLPEPTAAALRMAKPEAGPARPHDTWAQWLSNNATWDGEPQPGRPAVIYTSGTTGRPKGVVRASHATEVDRAAQVRNLSKVWGSRDGTRTLLMAPLYHSAPMAFVRSAIEAAKTAGELHFMPRFDAEAALRAIDEHAVTDMWMVPTMFVKLLQLSAKTRDRYDVSSVENVVHGAAPCPIEVKLRMIDWFGPVINEFYGSTELGPVTYAGTDDYLAKPGTVGSVLEGCRVAVVGADRRPLPSGQAGEIAAANTTFADFTYRQREQERAELDAGGLILTGDVGVIDSDGFLFLKDRLKDVVISGGVNLYPAEIEDVLLQLDNVRDGAAFGIPDDVLGEQMVVAVSLIAPETAAAERLKSALGERLSSIKVPRRIYVLDTFPRTEAGKVSKHKLREIVASESGRIAAGPVPTVARGT